MIVGAVDIGTNSMRLLLIDADGREMVRETKVTGLGTGVDATGVFDPERVASTLEVMERFGSIMDLHHATVRVAVATSASRDASNGKAFVSEVAERLGTTPQIIEGGREANLAFAGATHGRQYGRCVVVDIGGGSTEFIIGDATPSSTASIDIGSVRLTDRLFGDRPVSKLRLEEASAHVESLIRDVPTHPQDRVIGVAGTFTSLAAVSLGLPEYDRSIVDGAEISADKIEAIMHRLAGLSIDETAAIPSLNPDRAPVILAGAIIALVAVRQLGADAVTVSESDLLDALAAEALASGGGEGSVDEV